MDNKYYATYMRNKRHGDPEYRKLCVERTRQWRFDTRMKLLNLLGGKCVRCGETDWRCLQIDHINGGGRAEHDEHLSDMNKFYIEYIESNPNQTKYQILCANCNRRKVIENKEFGYRYWRNN